MTDTMLLKSKRVLAGLTQQQVADELNICNDAYSRKEKSIEPCFKQNEIEKLIDIYNLTNEETFNIFFAK